MNKQSIKRISGNVAVDNRGCVRYVNDFDFSGVHRFYQVENSTDSEIRAFHGHLLEAKYVYVPKGKILLCAVPIDDPVYPDKNAKVERIFLNADRPEIVYIPPGFANGFRVLVSNSVVIFFSTSTLAESKHDDYRFPFDYWGEEAWQIRHE